MPQNDFFANTEGLNTTDSPFFVKDAQATGGYNSEYTRTGAVFKRRGNQQLNSVADTLLKGRALGLFNPKTGDKTILRAANTSLQTVDIDNNVFTQQTDDTSAANTTFFSPTSDASINFSLLNTGAQDATWFTGGGASGVYGYNGPNLNAATPLPPKVTLNGVPEVLPNILQIDIGLSLWTAGTISVTLNGRTYSQAWINTGGTLGESSDASMLALAAKINLDQDVAGPLGTLTNTGAASANPYNGHNRYIVIQGNGGTTITLTSLTGSGGAPTPKQAILQNNQNGPATGVLAASISASTGGVFLSTGVLWYAIAFRKALTQNLSNACLDVSVTIATTGDQVTLTMPTITDATKYDQFYIYRSAFGGQQNFTTGELIAQIAVTQTTFIDLGSSLTDTINIQRANNVVLDNSILPSNNIVNGVNVPIGPYSTVTTWKQRLVAVAGSTAYISGLGTPEAWPQNLNVVVPTGGDIVAAAVIGFKPPTSFDSDENLILWKEQEMYEVIGSAQFLSSSNIYDIALRFVDYTGCVDQRLVVTTPGYVFWVSYRGVYMYNGSGKPVRISRPIESLFAQDGNFNKAQFTHGFGTYVAAQNKIYWVLSDKLNGNNTVILKLDLRLTLSKVAYFSQYPIELEGVFTLDTVPTTPLNAGLSFIPVTNPEEIFLTCDSNGFLYKMYSAVADPGNTGINFSYLTRPYDMGQIGVAKRFKKVIVWIDDLALTNKLTLSYWTDYKALMSDESQIAVPMSFGSSSPASLWDVAIWDESNWDEYTPQVRPIVYNLSSAQNNNEGDSITIQFSNNDPNSPVTLYGWSVLWEPVTLRK